MSAREKIPTPVPRYQIGDAVFVASWESVAERETCPDCLGTRELTVTTPAGETFKVGCQTCRRGWETTGTVVSVRYLPKVWRGIVGSVRVDTHDERPVSYMLEETGVGSGTVHYEENLFDSAEPAAAKATRKAKEHEQHLAAENEKRRANAKAKDLRFEERWKRHAKALCAAVQELAAWLKETPAALGEGRWKLVERIELYLSWIKPEEY